MKVVAEQAADYERAKGQTVTEQLIQANPEINCIYAHNDEMALGAVAALKDAGQAARRREDHHDRRHQGRRPGHRRRLDQRRHRVQPALRAAGLQALDDFYSGDGVPVKTIISDKEYTKDNAASRAAQRLLIAASGTGPA